MTTRTEDFDFFVTELLNRDAMDFKAKVQYKLLQEKLDQMDTDCSFMLQENEKNFAEECFELIGEVDSHQEQFVYRRGLLDGVMILKSLGVLS